MSTQPQQPKWTYRADGFYYRNGQVRTIGEVLAVLNAASADTARLHELVAAYHECEDAKREFRDKLVSSGRWRKAEKALRAAIDSAISTERKEDTK